jgi:hypothetical protein
MTWLRAVGLRLVDPTIWCREPAWPLTNAQAEPLPTPAATLSMRKASFARRIFHLGSLDARGINGTSCMLESDASGSVLRPSRSGPPR